MKLKGALLILLSIFMLSSCTLNNKSEKISSGSSEEEQVEKCREPFYHLDKKVDPTEEKDGYVIYQCGMCGYKKEEVIPKLSNEHYHVEEITYNCIHGNGKRYTSEQYGTYEVSDNMRSKHTIYGDVCEVGGHRVGEVKFSNRSTTAFAADPRLHQLR